jgi:integrase
MGQHLRYSKKQQRWRIYYRIVKDGKTIASDEIYAKKKGPALDWPKIPTKKQQEYLRANGYLPSDKDVREMMVRLDNEVASRGSTYETNDKIVVAQLCDMFMDNKLFTEGTQYIKELRSNIKNYIKPQLGYVKVKDLNAQYLSLLLKYVDSVKYDHKTKKHIFWQDHPDQKKVSYSTIRKVKNNLNAILNYACDNERKWISENPLKGVTTDIQETDKAKNYLRNVNQKQVFLTHNQVETIANSLRESNFQLAVLLTSVTGMRRGEVLGLKWKDWTEGKINFLNIRRQVYKCTTRNTWTTQLEDGEDKKPKYNSGRKISIGKKGVEWLQAQRNYQETYSALRGIKNLSQEDYIFSNLETGNLYSTDGLSQAFSRAVDRSIKQFKLNEIDCLVPGESHFHSLRHYHASVLINNGVSLAIVSKRLGHSSVGFTLKIYGHLVDGYDIESAELAEGYFADYDLD